MIRPINFSRQRHIVKLLMAGLLFPAIAIAEPAEDFSVHCASCHGEDRLGGTGPALIPETLGRVRNP